MKRPSSIEALAARPPGRFCPETQAWRGVLWSILWLCHLEHAMNAVAWSWHSDWTMRVVGGLRHHPRQWSVGCCISIRVQSPKWFMVSPRCSFTSNDSNDYSGNIFLGGSPRLHHVHHVAEDFLQQHQITLVIEAAPGCRCRDEQRAKEASQRSQAAKEASRSQCGCPFSNRIRLPTQLTFGKRPWRRRLWNSRTVKLIKLLQEFGGTIGCFAHGETKMTSEKIHTSPDENRSKRSTQEPSHERSRAMCHKPWRTIHGELLGATWFEVKSGVFLVVLGFTSHLRISVWNGWGNWSFSNNMISYIYIIYIYIHQIINGWWTCYL